MSINKVNIICLLSAINIFILSIENLGDYRFLVFPITFFMLILKKKEYKNYKLKLNIYILLILLLFSHLILNHIGFFTYKINIGYLLVDSLVSNVFKLTLVFLVLFFIESKKTLIIAIKWALIIHFYLYLIQLIVVYIFGYYIDYLNIFTGVISRYQSGYSLPILGAIYRPTGLYLEPSTFSSFIIVLATLKVYLEKEIERFDYIAVVVCISTFSIAAIIYASIYFITLYLKSNHKSYKKIFINIIFVILSPLVLYFISINYQERMIATEGTASEIRSNLNDAVLVSQSGNELMFGNGLLGLPDILAKAISNRSFWKDKIAAVNDNGTWLFIIMKFGVVGLLLLILFFYKISADIFQFLMLSNILLTKISFLQIEFIFFIFVLIVYSRDFYIKMSKI